MEATLNKKQGAYRKGKVITTDPSASWSPKGRGPVYVSPKRWAAWADAGLLDVDASEAEGEN